MLSVFFFCYPRWAIRIWWFSEVTETRTACRTEMPERAPPLYEERPTLNHTSFHDTARVQLMRVPKREGNMEPRLLIKLKYVGLKKNKKTFGFFGLISWEWLLLPACSCRALPASLPQPVCIPGKFSLSGTLSLSHSLSLHYIRNGFWVAGWPQTGFVYSHSLPSPGPLSGRFYLM